MKLNLQEIILRTLLKMLVGTSLLTHALIAKEEVQHLLGQKICIWESITKQVLSIYWLISMKLEKLLTIKPGYTNIITSVNSVKKLTNMGSNGIGLVMGYNHFFHPDKILGLRYFAF